ADDRAHAEIEIQHRREAEIDAAIGEFIGDQPTPLLGLRKRIVAVHVIRFTQLAHRRNAREAVAKALHASTLVVDSDQKRRRAHRTDVTREARQLGPRNVIACKENCAADERMREPITIGGSEDRSPNAEHHSAARELEPHQRDAVAASRNSDFLSRTASRMPTNTDRATIAWPMCSSRTRGSAAIGCTLN